MSRTLTAFFLLFALTGTTTAYAASSTASSQELSVAQWLANAARTVRTGSYRGVMVYLRKDQLDTLRVVHRYSNGVEQERLLALSGRPREIIRHGSRVVSILPANKVVLITHHEERSNLLSRISRFTSDRMRAHYRMEVLGERRLAGRPTRVISIHPRDQYRYGYRILIDQKTYLPLKLNLIYDQQVLEQLMFTEIAYPEHIAESAFEPSYDIDDFRVIDHKAMKVGNPPIMNTHWRLTELPPGFELVESGIRNTPNGPAVRQMLFTDGVATVSAFIAPADVPKPLIGGTTMGAVNAFGRAAGEYHITVVGEVPAVTVRMIAENLVYTGQTTANAGNE